MKIRKKLENFVVVYYGILLNWNFERHCSSSAAQSGG